MAGGDPRDRMTRPARIPNVLSIAGSDPSGGAGIQADLKTFAANRVYGMAVVTALTAQNTRGVVAVEPVRPEFVTAQIDAIFADIRVDAVKLGMLATATIARAVADALARHRPPTVVLDPVMVATRGGSLLEDAAVAVLRERLLPLADVLTPNLPEAGILLGEAEPRSRSAMPGAARRLRGLGPKTVLLKGGHLGAPTSPDCLATPDGCLWLDAPRVERADFHGTGCTLSAALAAHLAITGDVIRAAKRAKAYLRATMSADDAFEIGAGSSPLHHFRALWPS
jgi:hydroxymethylpyrimidine/phosphomethylpyrimidine kinase